MKNPQEKAASHEEKMILGQLTALPVSAYIINFLFISPKHQGFTKYN
jgi:hypothetical protein